MFLLYLDRFIVLIVNFVKRHNHYLTMRNDIHNENYTFNAFRTFETQSFFNLSDCSTSGFANSSGSLSSTVSNSGISAEDSSCLWHEPLHFYKTIKTKNDKMTSIHINLQNLSLIPTKNTPSRAFGAEKNLDNVVLVSRKWKRLILIKSYS